MNKKNSAPLIEIIIFIGVFSLCAVILVNLFLVSHYNGLYSNDISIANLKAQSIIENPKKTLDLSSTKIKSTVSKINYDKNWVVTTKEIESVYTIDIIHDIKFGKNGSLVEFKIVAKKIANYPFLNTNKTNLVNIEASTFIENKGE